VCSIVGVVCLGEVRCGLVVEFGSVEEVYLGDGGEGEGCVGVILCKGKIRWGQG
jgi:hypothetical protein